MLINLMFITTIPEWCGQWDAADLTWEDMSSPYGVPESVFGVRKKEKWEETDPCHDDDSFLWRLESQGIEIGEKDRRLKC